MEQGIKERHGTRYQRTVRNKALKNGEKNKQIEIVKKLKEENVPLETIIKVTGLTKNEILQICSKI